MTLNCWIFVEDPRKDSHSLDSISNGYRKWLGLISCFSASGLFDRNIVQLLLKSTNIKIKQEKIQLTVKMSSETWHRGAEANDRKRRAQLWGRQPDSTNPPLRSRRDWSWKSVTKLDWRSYLHQCPRDSQFQTNFLSLNILVEVMTTTVAQITQKVSCAERHQPERYCKSHVAFFWLMKHLLGICYFIWINNFCLFHSRI